MKNKIRLSAGMAVLVGLGMLAALCAPVNAAVRALKHVAHPRSYNSGTRPASRYSNSRYATAKYSARRGKAYHGVRSRRQPTQQAPMPDRIEEIQNALAQQGLYQGEPSGRMDVAMSEALRSFQERSGLNPTGKIDAASLQRLGLGSDTAGLNAPKPVLPSATGTTAKAAAPPTTPPGI